MVLKMWLATCVSVSPVLEVRGRMTEAGQRPAHHAS